MAAWGAPPEKIAEWRAILTKQANEHGVEIWPDHWHAWCVFFSMRTQWRAVGAFSGLVYTGLDYGALALPLAENRANSHRQPLAVLMPQLRELEIAARKELNE